MTSSGPGPGAWRRLITAMLALLAVIGLEALAAAPQAHASTGGSAQATGLHARSPEVRLQVQADGAIALVQPILDRLTRDPILTAREEIAAQVHTPEAPQGAESQSTPQRSIPQVLTVQEVQARTDREQDADLSARAQAGGVQVEVLGLDVLSVSRAFAEATTHPEQEPSAESGAPDVRVFSRAVDVRANDPIEFDESLSTAQVLAALEEAFPGLRGVIDAVGGVVQADGGIQVVVGRSARADPSTGAARAVGFEADVALDLTVDICVPRFGGSGCVAELQLRTDAEVLRLVLAEASVERPDLLPVRDRVPWTMVLVIGGAALIAGLLIAWFGLGRHRRSGRS